ncbi:hypothetical protein QMT40_000403 [Parvibaculaceae bacterium PLY_AMNH_Bact1]|nr:hypothetical protein QMT40_000403 [Parvibaculaceae bacterium PLY_AMNH_Bact1]
MLRFIETRDRLAPYAYMRTKRKDVIISNDEIHISGPKAVLAHALSNDAPLAPSMVPTFVDGWRA